MKRIGLILNNIGSPASPEPADVGTYLEEFLMDKEILTIPYILRYILVYFLIVPRRKFSSAEKYKKIWGQSKSPLIEISEDFAKKLQDQLGETYDVQLGMVNGEPSLKNALAQFKAKDIQQILFAPLYPQYARATTFAATEKLKGLARQIYGTDMSLKVLKPFYDEKGFVALSANKLKLDWNQKIWDHVVFSFHGLPESQIKKVEGCLQTPNCCQRAQACALNCYRAQSFKTAALIAETAGLRPDQFTISFQSRLGPARWIGPSSIEVVRDLGARGNKRILVQTPSFVADCLETLEEISIELKIEFIKSGGEDLKLVPCLNQDLDWVQNFADIIKAQ